MYNTNRVGQALSIRVVLGAPVSRAVFVLVCSTTISCVSGWHETKQEVRALGHGEHAAYSTNIILIHGFSILEAPSHHKAAAA